MFGQQIGVLAHTIAGAPDLDDGGMVKQAIQERCGDHGISEDLASFGKPPLGSHGEHL
nr:hypothetical protein [Sphingomonas sp. CDS-1]